MYTLYTIPKRIASEMIKEKKKKIEMLKTARLKPKPKEIHSPLGSFNGRKTVEENSGFLSAGPSIPYAQKTGNMISKNR